MDIENMTAKQYRQRLSELTKAGMKERKDNFQVFTGPIYGWDVEGDSLVPNWDEQDTIDWLRYKHYVEGFSGRRLAKMLDGFGSKGKKGGKWRSGMVLRTIRTKFHEKRIEFDPPEWWGEEHYQQTED